MQEQLPRLYRIHPQGGDCPMDGCPCQMDCVQSMYTMTVILPTHCHPVQGLYRIHPQGGDCPMVGYPCQMDCVQPMYTMTAEVSRTQIRALTS